MIPNSVVPIAIVVVLLVMSVGGPMAQVSADSLVRVTAVRDAYPSWSPDGSMIVFASNRSGATRGNFHIYIMNADGSNVVKVLENDALVEDARPVWSPDGSSLVFNRQYVADESSIDILILRLPPELSVTPLKTPFHY